jgi:hypothetical protein
MADRPEELRVIDEILGSIESRIANIAFYEKDIRFLGDQFRNAAREAKQLYDPGPVSSYGKLVKEVTEAFDKYTKAIKRATVAQVAMAGAFGGFLTGLRGAGVILNGFGALLKTTFTVGTSILGAFQKTIGAVFGFFYGALKSGGGGTGLYEELQEIRKQFGGLEDFTSQAIFAVADNLRELPRRLAAVGFHLRDIIKNAREYAETLGPLFMQFVREEFTPATVLFLKGMGASEEASVSIVQSARAMGQDLNETLEGVARNGAAVAAAIGESRKVIQREMLEARRDIATFGSVADDELAVVIGRFRSLGLEAEAAAGLVANFDTFEDAANAVSQLSVAFGVQLDTFRLVNEENPANRLDYLRQQLFRAGRSAEQMSRRELMVLGETLGETDLNMVRLALSAENAGMSMEDIRTAAEESGEQTKSMEEVLSDLANAMERMVMSGAGYNTFLEAMNYGIERGIRYFLWETGVMFAYRRALHETAWGFRELTMSFLRNFPGIEDVVMGLRDLFDPARFRTMFNDIEDAIESFLTPDNFDVRGFFGALYDALFTFFDPAGDAMSRIIEGGRQILQSLMEVTRVGLGMFSEWVFGDPQNGIAARLVRGFRDALRFLVSFLDPDTVARSFSSVRNFAGGFFEGFITPIIEFFRSPAIRSYLSEIVSLLGRGLLRIWDNINNLFMTLGGRIFEAIGAGFLVNAEGQGPSMIRSLLYTIFAPTLVGAISGVVLKGAAHAITGSLFNNILSSAQQRGTQGGGGGLISRVISAFTGGTGAGGAAAVPANAISNTNRGTQAAAAAGNAARSSGQVVDATQGAGRRFNPARFAAGVLGIMAVAAFLAGTGYILINALNELDIRPGLMEKSMAFLAITGGITLLSVAVMGLGTLIGGTGGVGLAAIAAGGAAVVALGAILSGGFLLLINSLKNINITDSALGALEVMPQFFMGIAAVTGSIAGILVGLAMGGPIGGVRRLNNLFENISGFMQDSTDHILVIMEKANVMFSNASSQSIENTSRGVEMFVSITEAISDLLPNLAEIVRSSSRGFSIGRSRARAIASTFVSLREFMSAVFSSDDAIIIDIIDLARSSGLQDPSVARAFSSVVVPAIESFSSILDTMPDLVEQLSRSRGIGRVSFNRDRRRAERFANVIEAIEGIMTVMADRVSDLMGNVIESIGSINIGNLDPAIMDVVGPVLNFVSTIMSSIADQNAAFAAMLSEGRAGTGGSIIEVKEEAIEAMGQNVVYMTTAIAGLLRGGVVPAIQDLISTLTASNLTIPEGSAGLLSAAGNVLEAVAAFIGPMLGTQSDQSRAMQQFLEAGDSVRRPRRVLRAIENMSSDSVDYAAMASGITQIISSLSEPISDLVSTVMERVVSIEDPEGFASKIASVSTLLQAVSSSIEIAGTLTNLGNAAQADNVFRVGGIRVQHAMQFISQVVRHFEESLQISNVDENVSLLQSINNNLMPELTNFFERYGELNTAITDSGIIDLPQVTIDKIATLLPAAAAATETLGAEITTDSIRVAMAGNTFNISVVMEIDGRELGRVAAENLTTQ